MRIRSTAIVTYPQTPAVTVADAKAHLSIVPAQTEDDGQITAMVQTATSFIQRRLGVMLGRTQIRVKYDLTDGQGWPKGAANMGRPLLPLPYSPVLTGQGNPVVVDVDGVAAPENSYSVDADESPGVIRFLSLPNMNEFSVLTVTYWAGPSTVGVIAPQLRSALLLYVGHLYANREAVTAAGGQPSEVPMAFEALMASESTNGRY